MQKKEKEVNKLGMITIYETLFMHFCIEFIQ